MMLKKAQSNRMCYKEIQNGGTIGLKKEAQQQRDAQQLLREEAQQQRDAQQLLREIAEAKVEEQEEKIREQAAELEKLRQQLSK